MEIKLLMTVVKSNNLFTVTSEIPKISATAKDLNVAKLTFKRRVAKHLSDCIGIQIDIKSISTTDVFYGTWRENEKV